MLGYTTKMGLIWLLSGVYREGPMPYEKILLSVDLGFTDCLLDDAPVSGAVCVGRFGPLF